MHNSSLPDLADFDSAILKSPVVQFDLLVIGAIKKIRTGECKAYQSDWLDHSADNSQCKVELARVLDHTY